MPENTAPELIIVINQWTLWGHPAPDREWTLEERVAAVAAAGFDAYSAPADTAGLKVTLAAHGLRFAGAFDAAAEDQFAPRIRAILEVGDGPVNCQLADHDTPVKRAVELTAALMEEADRQGAEVHLEVHRDTCTETPEKTHAIAEGVKQATGKYPRVNFDFSHPAVVKHLDPSNYAERLFENIPLFQQSTLWHMRPFNGHHCQIPVTDGRGNFSPEYLDIRPFIRQALDHWLDDPRPRGALWVMPELGPKPGYGLSCFPPVWDDAVALGNDIRRIWNEALAARNPDR
ncbi:MAG: hypothetical protein JJU00_05330 [Opitutales bacterium]|nr:hypothetical protein [Opitutales bacterium]